MCKLKKKNNFYTSYSTGTTKYNNNLIGILINCYIKILNNIHVK